ncbi:MAG: HlyD family secretion protein [Thermonemataceae bacterium]|mgnify:CR=1 FL=1
MKNLQSITLLLGLVFCFSACKDNEHTFDASGAFEADEIIIAAEANGIIKTLKIEEGQKLKAGTQVGYIDSTQLHLRKKQMRAQIAAIDSRLPNIAAQTSFYTRQQEANKIKLENLLQEQKRFKQLVEGGAATEKQLDDIDAQVDELTKQLEVIQQQRTAQVSALQTQAAGLKNDPLPLLAQIEQIEDQIESCEIINPIDGTVLVTYAEPNEMTSEGKALYKIADLSEIILRVYISGTQLPQVKINQKVKVYTDNGKGDFKETTGVVTWISDKAEFTPKDIQTKDERANRVYAMKVKVKNDGTYKIGMYGEIKF